MWNIFYKYFIIMAIIFPFFIIVYYIFILDNYPNYLYVINILHNWKWIVIIFGFFYFIKAKNLNGLFNFILVISTGLFLSFLFSFIGLILINTFIGAYTLLSIFPASQNDHIKEMLDELDLDSIKISYKDNFNKDILDELKQTNSRDIFNKDILDRLYPLKNNSNDNSLDFPYPEGDRESKSKERNIVTFLCKFFVFDVIINPSKYHYYPSCFQSSSITLPPTFTPLKPVSSSILDMLPPKPKYFGSMSLVDLLRPDYDTPFSTMPRLSVTLYDEFEVLYYEYQTQVFYLISQLKLSSPDDVDAWNEVINMLDIYRNRDSRNGELYDIFTEFILNDNRMMPDIRFLELERDNLWWMMRQTRLSLWQESDF